MGEIRKIYTLISDAVKEKKGKNINNDIQIKYNISFSNIKELGNYCNDYFVKIGQKMFKEIKKNK